MRSTSTQNVSPGQPETNWYVYNASGQRTRSVTDRRRVADEPPQKLHEQIFLDRFDVSRQYSGRQEMPKSCETVHVHDEGEPILCVENRSDRQMQLLRYQIKDDHYSIGIELDGSGQVFSLAPSRQGCGTGLARRKMFRPVSAGHRAASSCPPPQRIPPPPGQPRRAGRRRTPCRSRRRRRSVEERRLSPLRPIKVPNLWVHHSCQRLHTRDLSDLGQAVVLRLPLCKAWALQLLGEQAGLLLELVDTQLDPK